MPACRMMLRKTGTDKSNRSCLGTVTRQLWFPRMLQLRMTPALVMNLEPGLLQRAQHLAWLEDGDARRHQALSATRSLS